MCPRNLPEDDCDDDDDELPPLESGYSQFNGNVGDALIRWALGLNSPRPSEPGAAEEGDDDDTDGEPGPGAAQDGDNNDDDDDDGPVMTQWGWTGSNSWRAAVGQVAKGGTIESINGKIPTEDEAEMLLDDADCTDPRPEGPHDPPNPHQYDHINYYTPSGIKGTIQIQK